ncbi:retrovirus-related pol polyprotein from transposon TNT 1-94 [Tanacetum coccineum]
MPLTLNPSLIPLEQFGVAHLNYISHLKESVEMVREIVEEARVVKPLDNTLNYACQYTKLSQELLEYVIGTCPKSFNERDNKFPLTLSKDYTEASGSKPRKHYKEIIGSCLSLQVMIWYLGIGDVQNCDGGIVQSHEFCGKVRRVSQIRGHGSLGAIMGYGDCVYGENLVRGLPRLKFEKDHLCSACQLGKSKKFSHRPKSENTNMEVLHTLHMDLCGPMRVQSIKGKKYILVIVDDYSRFTWVKFLRSKDETPEFVTNFLKQIQVGLNKIVRFIRTDNGTEKKGKNTKEIVNQVMSEYYEGVGIFHQKSVLRTPQQNGIVERRNRTLVEAARTMMIFLKAPMFLWAEAVATACYTQNRSLIHTRHNKTPYELVHDKKPDLTFFRVFGALCYPTNIAKIWKNFKQSRHWIFVGYAPSRKGYRLLQQGDNRQLMESILVKFDEMHQSMAPAA